jgi:hypothetical protein
VIVTSNAVTSEHSDNSSFRGALLICIFRVKYSSSRYGSLGTWEMCWRMQTKKNYCPKLNPPCGALTSEWN